MPHTLQPSTTAFSVNAASITSPTSTGGTERATRAMSAGVRSRRAVTRSGSPPGSADPVGSGYQRAKVVDEARDVEPVRGGVVYLYCHG